MRKLLGSAAVAAVAAGIATVVVVGGTAAPEARATTLPAFDSCGSLLAYAKRTALRVVGPYGLDGGIMREAGVPMPAPAAEAATDAAAPTPSDTGTNVQEAGVDEADIVKTANGIVFAIAQQKIQAVDVNGDTPRLVGSLALPDGAWGGQLLLSGDRLLLVGGGGGVIEPLAATDIMPAPGGATLTEIDVSNPAAMQLVKTITLDGWLVGARLTGSSARVVVSSQPTGLAWTYPQSDSQEALAAAEAENRAIVRRSRLANWIPSYRVKDYVTGNESAPRRLVSCDEVRHPREFSGLGSLTVLTIDLSRGVEPVDSDSVLSGGDTVYASPTGLYVATQRWLDVQPGGAVQDPPSVLTAIHKFDISSPDSTDYRASGQVSGYLLNQWSLSERDGFLRVVTTEEPGWWGGPETPSRSTVSVLADTGDRLAVVGELGGLGRGERVYAVRFVDDLAYVVTFRQVDPLHVIDLSNPEQPVLRGELRIPGYSAYLHPIGDDLLLGVGQDATEDGRVQGTQISVFDVSDPSNPVRLHHFRLGQGGSQAEWDHHAFLYDAAHNLAVLPFETSTWDETTGIQSYWSGAVALAVSRSGIEQLRTIEHPGIVYPGPLPTEPEPVPTEPPPDGGGQEPAQAEPPADGSGGQGGGASGTTVAPVPPDVFPTPVQRSLVLGDVLYTLSEAGLEATSLETLEDTAWVAFPTP
jgi:beta propeller domain-containing protein